MAGQNPTNEECEKMTTEATELGMIDYFGF